MGLLATNYSFDGQTDIYRGEVRDVYVLEDKLIAVATDRLSIFGYLFPDPIPYKGQVLNQLSNYFAEATDDIVPSWLESVPDPNVAIGKKCQRFEVNMVIRGALIGHAWRVYQAGMRTISGVELPDGLNEYDVFEEPLITPTTKTAAGYEEDITATQIIERNIMSESQFERLSIIARQLFIRGKQLARKQGLVLADTKYEFGLYEDQIYLIDEIHTPDSSRYFEADKYEAYLNDRNLQTPADLSKEYVRRWVLNHGYSGLDNQQPPILNGDFITSISNLYISLYERLTDTKFIYPIDDVTLSDRIERNINNALKIKEPR